MSESTDFKITTITKYERPNDELFYFLLSFWDAWDLELIHSEKVPFIDEDGFPDHKTKNIFRVVIFELNDEESKNIIQNVKNKAKLNDCEIEIINILGYHSNKDLIKI